MRIQSMNIHKVFISEKETEPFYLDIQIKGTTEELKDLQTAIYSLVNTKV
jgi:hypothetical protein